MTERVDAFLRRLGDLSVDDLTVLALAPADPDERERLLDRIDAAARATGRLDEIDEAADRAHDALVGAFAVRGLDPTWFGLNWGRSLGRSADRAVLLQAVEDAALLAEPFELVAGMVGAAPTANPSAGRMGPNLVRIAWVVGAVGWIVLGTQVVVELVDDIVRQVNDNWLF
jgi:hypothetical protein